MKQNRFFILALALVFGGVFATSAQLTAVRHEFARSPKRTEITLPKVKGFNLYKAELHSHTIYSDGDLTPAMRVEEAWHDGLDIIAVTDHMEYRRIEREMYRYMKGYIDPEKQGEKWAINTNVLNKAPDERGLLVDFNVSSDMAALAGEKFGILVIQGVEITRGKLGDYNALFTKDNNALYDPNLEQTIRNARAQGAFIFHNHPQYRKNTKSTMPAHCDDLHAKGLIDGIEIVNGWHHYTNLDRMCMERNYAPIATSDVHFLITDRFPGAGKDYYRNMTLILSKKCDEKSIKKALFAKRTIAYSQNMLMGKEDLLQELFKASVEVESLGVVGKTKRVKITNNCSFPYSFKWAKGRTGAVLGLGTTIINVPIDCKELELEVTNMLYNEKDSPKVAFKLKK